MTGSGHYWNHSHSNHSKPHQEPITNNNNIAFFPKQVEGAFVKATKKTCNVKIKLLLEQGGGMFSWLVS